jgi:pyruvate kinase
MQTKIVATLGPASLNPETMRQMVKAGVRIFRLNFSHSDAAYFVPAIKAIREIEGETGLPLTALGDLCGPKVRIGEVENSPRVVNKGEYLLLGLPDQRPEERRSGLREPGHPGTAQGTGRGHAGQFERWAFAVSR